MLEMSSFHDVRFPTDISISSSGGPVRSTEIVTLGSGREQRNQRWSQSRRRFDAGFGAKDLVRLQDIVAFYEARRGPLYAFRFKDPLDFKSCSPVAETSGEDQTIGTGDGSQTEFQLIKSYGEEEPFVRAITKPVEGTVSISINGTAATLGTDFELNYLTGLMTILTPPNSGDLITAGFEFDVPVRFEADELNINLAAFTAGDIPNIPLIEVNV